LEEIKKKQSEKERSASYEMCRDDVLGSFLQLKDQPNAAGKKAQLEKRNGNQKENRNPRK